MECLEFCFHFPHPAGVDVIAVLDDTLGLDLPQDDPVAIVGQDVAVPVELPWSPSLGLALGRPGGDVSVVQAIEAVILGLEFALEVWPPHKLEQLGQGLPEKFYISR